MNHGPSFDFDKPTHLSIRALSVEVAQANLDAYDTTCPGPYRLDLPANHQHNEAWRRWAAGRQEHLTALTIAKACNGSHIHAPKKAKPTNPGHVQGYPVQHFVDRMNEFLQKMDRLPETDPEWYHLRNQACSCRHAAMKRARQLRDTTTHIPEIPRKRREGRRPMDAPMPSRKRNAYYKPLAHFVAKLQGLLDEMARLDVWTNEWEGLRDRACAARSAAQRRAFELGDTTTHIPEVPRRGPRPK